MKNKILTGVLAIIFSIPTQGQFLKKPEEKSDPTFQADTKTILVFPENKNVFSSDVGMNDPILEMGFLRGKEQVDPSAIPESYDFDWKYIFEIKTKNGESRVNLLFKKDAPYFGFLFSEAPKGFLVIDPEININTLFTGQGDSKITSATKILEPMQKVTNQKKNPGIFSFNKIGNKSIIGYESVGFQVENNEFVYTFYVAKETRTGIHNFQIYSQKLMPENLNPNWLEKGMLMQMISEGKKSARDNITITCIGIEKYPLQLKKGENMSLAKN